MKNADLLKHAQASLDILRGYTKALDADALSETDVLRLTEIVTLAATVPIHDTLRRSTRRSLTED